MFKMTGVGRHLNDQVDLGVLLGQAVPAHVIFHIARPAQLIPGGRAPLRVGELGQDLAIGFIQYVCQHIQTSAVRHADQDHADLRADAAEAIASSSMGTIISRPSIEKRVLPGYKRCRNSSNASTCVNRSSSLISSTSWFGSS
jgi:myo-inositol catabolism protein IolC